MKLNQIRDNEGARQGLLRVGRGPGSGRGKTCGRGVKGQKSRTGVRLKGFEGGQMPIYRRLPKRGFTNINDADYRVVNVGALQAAVDSGLLDTAKTITEVEIQAAGLIGNLKDGVRVLGNGKLKAKLSLKVHGVTKTARAAIEKAGGSIELLVPVKEAKAEATEKKSKKK